ncbi:MAG TPA: hypothetical protein VF222_03215, partial [Nitrososphaeraceae archaeon]
MDKSVTLSLLLMGSLIMLVPFPNMNIFSNAMAIEDYSDKGNNDNNRYQEEDSDKGNNDNNSPKHEEEDSDKGNNDNNSPKYEEDYSDKGNYANNLPKYEEDYSDNYRVDSSQQSTYDNGYGYDDKNKPPEIFPAN